MPLRENVNTGDASDVRRQVAKIVKALNGQPKFATLTTQTSDCNVEWGFIVPVNPTGGAITVSIPSYDGHEGEQIVVKNVSTSTNTITIQANGSETIDGAATATISASRVSRTLIALKDGVAII